MKNEINLFQKLVVIGFISVMFLTVIMFIYLVYLLYLTL